MCLAESISLKLARADKALAKVMKLGGLINVVLAEAQERSERFGEWSKQTAFHYWSDQSQWTIRMGYIPW